jgi:acyl-coenzyme A synthetase/AMP-(fatty) acid ligase
VAVFGERMPLSALRAAMDALPHAEFWNVYSATEAFDMVHYTVPRPLSAEASDLPLGYPHPAYELSLRDERGEEVGPGEVGEICVVGPAVTIGYWNDPELSEAKRLADVPDSYRTGDLARQAEDGLITLVGRKDHQAKLRGHRFDLGEIEAAAKAEPRVREAVAFIDGAAAEAEVVLAVLTDAAADERKEIERAVWLIGRKRLPRYARPGRIVMFSEFPLLSSGKIDRGALKALIASS